MTRAGTPSPTATRLTARQYEEGWRITKCPTCKGSGRRGDRKCGLCKGRKTTVTHV